MLCCCGKQSKKKVKGEKADSHTNGAFVQDEGFKGDEKTEGATAISSVAEKTGMGDSVMGKGTTVDPVRGRAISVDQPKSILQSRNSADRQKRRESARTRSVSFTLPSEDVPTLSREQLDAMFEEVDKIEEAEEEELRRKEKSVGIPKRSGVVAGLKDSCGEFNVLDDFSDSDDNTTLKEGNHKSKMSNQVPQLTKPAPVFKGTAVVDGQFQEISLADYQGKYVVFFFYPLDFTFVCPTEIIAFSDRVQEFRDINCEVIACSTDSHFSHLAWINTPRKEGGLGDMNIPLLADKSMEIAKSYGVLKEEDGIAFRGLFIIDDKGNLRQVTINDLPVGRDVDETLRLVQAFQFTDEHGEVCPAGWRPGGKTMKADPSGSKEYFQSEN